MCGRYSLRTSLADIGELFDADVRVDEPGARYNISPTETVPVVRAEGGRHEVVGLRWGLVPAWAKGPGDVPLMINARSESLDERPAFRDLLGTRRCVVPADGFYEWRTEEGRRQPYHIRRRDGRPMALAALWDRWDRLESVAVVTTDANELLRPLHDRMPVVLSRDEALEWIDVEESDFERLRAFLRPCDPERLEAFPVTPRVNRVGEDDPDCVAPLAEPVRDRAGWDVRPGPASPAADAQLGLFREETAERPR